MLLRIHFIFHMPVCVSHRSRTEVEQEPLPDDWYLVESNGKRNRIPHTMLFMGREHCDVTVQCDSVDKRHAVLTYDVFLSKFKIKDLSSINKTYVNDTRIQEQEYVVLNHMDTVQLGHDSPTYRVEKGGQCTNVYHSVTERMSDVEIPPTTQRTQGLIDGPNCMTLQGHPDVAFNWPQIKLRRFNASGMMPENDVRSNQEFPMPLIQDNYKQDFVPCSNEMPASVAQPASPPHPPPSPSSTPQPPVSVPVRKNSKTYEYELFLNQQSLNDNGISHVHGKIILEESETEQKASSLYGQPEWWGENEMDTIKEDEKKDNTGEHEVIQVQSETPSSLDVKREKKEVDSMEKYRTDPQYQQTYMEIPIDDLVKDQDSAPHGVSSSQSKENVSGVDSSHTDNKIKSPPKKSADSMVFTVDFGDDSKQKKNLNSQQNLRDFLPSRIRERFEKSQIDAIARKEKNRSPEMEMSSSHHRKSTESIESKRSKKSVENGHRRADSLSKSTPRRKSLTEDTKTKTVTNRHNVDDKNTTRKDVRSSTRKPIADDSKNKTSARKSETQYKTKVQHSPSEEVRRKTVRQSPLNENRTRKSQSVDDNRTRPTRNSPAGEARSRRPAHKSPVEEVKSGLSLRRSPQQERIIRDSVKVTGSKPVKLSRYSPASSSKSGDTGSISPSNYSDTTSYLIDKMFEGSQQESSTMSGKNGDTGGVNANETRVSCSSPEDKLSDAGTYTIETEADKDEEEAARRRIDEVFGLMQEQELLNRSISGEDTGLQITDVDVFENISNSTPTDEFSRQTSLEVQEGSYPEDLCDTSDVDYTINRHSNDYKMTSAQEDVPIWMSQLANLANQKSSNKVSSENLESEIGQDGNKYRKRPGTGRRLPSVPTNGNEILSVRSESSQQSGEDTPRQLAKVLSRSERCKTVTISKPVLDRKTEHKSSAMLRNISDSGSESGIDGIPYNGQDDSARTCSSLDTQTLLKDTETVMAAMEARMATKHTNGPSIDYESDTDISSTVALVNGSDNYKRHPMDFKGSRNGLNERRISSPRDSYQSSCTTSSPRETPSPVTPNYTKPLKGASAKKPPLHTKSTPTTTRSKSLSHRSSTGDYCETESIRTDSDTESVKNAQKGPMSQTRPNRSFVLRRNKALGSEDSNTPSDSSRSGSSNTTTLASSRPTTAKSSSRPNTNRSEASLGAHIVKKSQDNLKSSQPLKRETAARKSLNLKSGGSKSDLTRSDGGRHSLRLTRTSSAGPAPVETVKRKADLKSLKSQLKSTDLSVKGKSAGSQSQPASRNNSPKTAAWKRRKEYDPRKAVAEAKAKTKSSRTRAGSEHSVSQGRMTRSSSFTTAAELSGQVRRGTYRSDSTSSVEDLSLTNSEAIDNFNEDVVRCAFIPIGNTLRSDRMSHSADEEEFSSHSAQELSRSMTLADNVRKSAFTTPSPKQMSASPLQRSPSLPRSRRSTFGSIDYSVKHREQNGLHRAESYNPILVTSIYQLSLKMKTDMDKVLHRLQDDNRLASTPSPITDYLDQPGKSEFPAWKSANQELAGILKNLRKLEHQNQVLKAVLFPDESSLADISGVSHREKQKYFQQLNRLSREITEFQPIDNPNNNCLDEDTESPDMAELQEEEFY